MNRKQKCSVRFCHYVGWLVPLTCLHLTIINITISIFINGANSWFSYIDCRPWGIFGFTRRGWPWKLKELRRSRIEMNYLSSCHSSVISRSDIVSSICSLTSSSSSSYRIVSNPNFVSLSLSLSLYLFLFEEWWKKFSFGVLLRINC